MTPPDAQTAAEKRKADIQQRYEDFKIEDLRLRSEALRAISERNAPIFAALEAECGQTGHKWKFDRYNWDNSYVWDKCEYCGASEGADKHEQR